MFYPVFLVCAAIFGVITYSNYKTESSSPAVSRDFKKWQYSFLAIYLVMMAADWMQGPYVYSLYKYYGFSIADNGKLFIAGFGSSLIFGTIAGSMSDKYGRKKACIAYGLTYIGSCITKHFPTFEILMVGRVLGGISTSILFSAFESWMVAEHGKRGFDASWMKQTFSRMTIGNGLVAIVAGWIAQYATEIYQHPVAPFDVSAVFLLFGTLAISIMWTENHGDAFKDTSSNLIDSVKNIFANKKVLILGCTQSLFEGSMYTFVFMWTPVLEDAQSVADGGTIPHGVIFASFMVCCSIGGAMFDHFSNFMPEGSILTKVFLWTAGFMLAPIFFADNIYVCYAAFLGFEICVGVFWPAISTLRSKHIPEESRATVMNLFRVPLNIFVCLILLYIGSLGTSDVFTITFVAYITCAILQQNFNNCVAKESVSSEGQKH